MKVRIIKEVYSEKQRRFFCASDDPKLKAKCDDPIKKEVIAEAIDKDYLKQQGIQIGAELGSGMFGVVYAITADVGEGMGSYALKYVDRTSPGYVRERKNYQAAKKFVELANIRQDAEAQKLGLILPIVYSVSEHGNGLYIIMEKLIPLSSEEEKLFMGEVAGLAYMYSEKFHQSRGEQLIDYIIDRDGNIGIKFGDDKAMAAIKSIVKAPEYYHLKSDMQKLIPIISNPDNSDKHGELIFAAWADSAQMDDVKYVALEELFKLNKDFRVFMNGIGKVLITQARDPSTEQSTNMLKEKDFIGMLMNDLFNTIFSQKYPMKYTDDPHSSPFDTGHGQSSEIWDADIQPNPKLKETKKQYGVTNVTANPAQKGGKRVSPQKYPFDAIISAIRKLGRDWNIVAKDMHDANVMKRANGQFVIADIGLFNTKMIQSMKSGIFESRRKIKVRII
tara:strand:- start:474 stop:1817 length:1344 start_codon:yes stop_codon:yes gene_type:complete